MTSSEKTANAERQLINVLKSLSDSISFCASGAIDLILPGLFVHGVGAIGAPIRAKDAKAIMKQASQAPYGRGEETIVDTKVRKVWQLEPNQFEIQNPQWNSLLDKVVSEVRAEFAINQRVTADLYKLLVYEKGSFFIPHRDTEKAERMFATLVICLPSPHEGGSLIVTNAGQSREIEFGGDAAKFGLQYAAFYADCQHEVRPVTKGYRVCLVYNLSIARSKQQPIAPQSDDAIATAAAALASLFEGEERLLVAIPLVHQYTEAGLAPSDSESSEAASQDDWENEDEDWDDDDEWDEEAETDDDFSSAEEPRQFPSRTAAADTSAGRTLEPLELKGADRARVSVLVRAAQKSNCRAFVALLTHWQSGYPNYDSLDYSSHLPYWGRTEYAADVSDQNQSAEFEEVFEESMTLSHWFDTSGRQQPFKSLEISETEIISDLPPEDRPYRQQLHEATGNEGVSMERWYRQAVIVHWPEARHFRVLAAQGVENSVPALCELVATTNDPSRCDDCREFADEILRHWGHRSRYRQTAEVTPASKMIGALLEIGDKRLTVQFAASVLPTDYVGLDGRAFTRLAEQTGWNELEPALKSFFQKQSPDDFQSDLAELAALYGAICCSGPPMSAARKSTCKSLAGDVEQMLDHWDRHKSPSWCEETRRGVVEPVLRGFCASGASDHVHRFLGKVTTSPERYDLHTAVIPAAQNLLSDKSFSGSGAPKLAQDTAKKLTKFCLDELERRTATKPQPPSDWSREGTLDCKCEDCRELAKFLQDKNKQVLRLPRRKDLRQHLHRQVNHHRLDMAHVTQRVGRPYTLVLTKNQASYERELAQFKTDQKLLSQFAAY